MGFDQYFGLGMALLGVSIFIAERVRKHRRRVVLERRLRIAARVHHPAGSLVPKQRAVFDTEV